MSKENGLLLTEFRKRVFELSSCLTTFPSGFIRRNVCEPKCLKRTLRALNCKVDLVLPLICDIPSRQTASLGPCTRHTFCDFIRP